LGQGTVDVGDGLQRVDGIGHRPYRTGCGAGGQVAGQALIGVAAESADPLRPEHAEAAIEAIAGRSRSPW
jgi:hypothetical protein